MYELIYHDKKLQMTRDPQKMIRQIEQVFPGNENGYEKYMKDTQRKLEKLAPLLQSPKSFYRYVKAGNV